MSGGGRVCAVGMPFGRKTTPSALLHPGLAFLSSSGGVAGCVRCTAAVSFEGTSRLWRPTRAISAKRAAPNSVICVHRRHTRPSFTRRKQPQALLQRGVARRSSNLNEAVIKLGVARAHRLAAELGDAAVERRLTALKARPRWAATTRVLTAHAETARAALAGAHAAALADLAVRRARRGLQVVQHELRRLLVGPGPALPVEDLHADRAGLRG